ncbi:unnamed protein product [Ilex paraguariensis]|uniref:ABC transporter domain-containing protein n=1 Tax=Ilex paraguariensis TaxID=185542 RepID=A0ABC8TEG1_9AQUA
MLASFKYAGEFDDVLDTSNRKSLSGPSKEIHLRYCDIENSTFLNSNGSVPIGNCRMLLAIESLTLLTPASKAMLIRDLSLEIFEKDHLLVMGPSGSGKTSLLRAIAGLWSTGSGVIRFYVKNAKDPEPPLPVDVAPCVVTASDDVYWDFGRPICGNSTSVFFLPQRPYMVLGTLRQQLLYPTWTEDSVSMSDTSKPTGITSEFYRYVVLAKLNN